MNDKQIELSVSRKPSFVEVWYEGSVKLNDELYQFWLIDPQTPDPNGNNYEVEVRWFFKNVPMEIRKLNDTIVQHYLEMRNEKTNPK